MMELQGAIGIAQLGKLDYMIEQQKIHKRKLKEAAAAIPGVMMRDTVDPAGDSATFFAFILADKEQCQRVNKHLTDNGVGAINFSENSWHYYPEWEHLLNGSTLIRSGWPFKTPDNKRRVVYSPDVLPKSAAIMERTLVYPISVKMDADKLQKMCDALISAAHL